MHCDAPKPESTLAIIFGASTWPKYPSFQDLPGSKASAEALRDYLLDKKGLRLPEANLRYLFDAHDGSSAILADMSQFLHRRTMELREQGRPAKDLIVFYVGHGGFADSTSDYFLAIRATQKPDPYVSSIPVRSLAKALKDETRHLRRYIILDSCFSGAAYTSFQSTPVEVAVMKTNDSFPPSGTGILCSSGARDPSKAPPGLAYTMFSGALLELLRNGDSEAPGNLSLQDLAYLTRRKLYDAFEDEAVRPEVHSPEQRRGDVGEVPLFPNLAKQNAEEGTRSVIDEKFRQAEALVQSEAQIGKAPAEVQRLMRRTQPKFRPLVNLATNLSFLILSLAIFFLFVVGVGLGTVYLFLTIVAFLYFPEPTEAQIFEARIVSALVAACVGGIVLAYTRFKITLWQRAGGAIIIFAIVYLINLPTLLTKTETDSVRSVTDHHEQTEPKADTKSIERRVSLGSSERELEKVIRPYLRFLDETGFPKAVSELRVKMSTQIEHEANAFYDANKSTAVLGRYFWSDATAALREYTHHVLFLYHPRRMQRGHFGGIESGLADYFPASFLNSPLIGATAARELREAGRMEFPHDYIRNLKNDRNFLEMQQQPFVIQDAGEIWGGLWWSLRDTLGPKQTNQLLQMVWRTLPDSRSGPPLTRWFSSTLHAEAIAIANSDETRERITAIWTERGFPLSP